MRYEPSSKYWDYRKKLSDQAKKVSENAERRRASQEPEFRRRNPRNKNDIQERRKETP